MSSDEMPAYLSASFAANPALVVVALLLAASVAFTLDRWLGGTSRRIQHARAHGGLSAGGNTLSAAALATSRPLLLAVRVCVWAGLVWFAGEVSPSLRFVRTLVTVVGRTAITAPLFMLNQRGYSILDVVELPFAVLAAWLAVKYAGRLLDVRLARSGRVDAGTRDTITLLGRCVIGFTAAMIILHTWGVDMSSFTVAAGVIGVGVGFGLQNITSNFVSGLLVSLERPIRPGDFVKVGDLTGTVKRIGLRCTEIVTLDRVSILVPNSQFLEKEVVNWSYGDPVYRLHVPVSVAYASDVAAVRGALLEAAASHRAVLHDPKPHVDFHGFGTSALEFELLVWARDPKQQNHLLSDLNYRVEASLRAHGIEIPFPQLDLHVRTPAGSEQSAPSLRREAHGNGAGHRPPALSGVFDAVCDTHAWTDEEIEALLERMRGDGGVPLADRRHRLRVYERCFVGREVVDWLVSSLGVGREEAAEIGCALVARGAIHHVLHEQAFKDGHFFYRFRADENGEKSDARTR